MTAAARPASVLPLATSIFVVEGMRCAGCIAKLEHGLAALPGVAAARVNFTNRQVRIDHLDEIDEDGLIGAIDGLGFTAHAFAGATADSGRSESRRLVLALAVAGFAMMNVMLLSVSIWSGADGATRQLFHWLSALIALPTVAYSGRVFFASAWSALRRGRTNMDVPISIGVLLAVAMSLYETVLGGPHAYFDGVVMLLFFLLGGRFLDSVMRDRARGGVDALLRRLPAEATVIASDGGHQRRAACRGGRKDCRRWHCRIRRERDRPFACHRREHRRGGRAGHGGIGRHRQPRRTADDQSDACRQCDRDRRYRAADGKRRPG